MQLIIRGLQSSPDTLHLQACFAATSETHSDTQEEQIEGMGTMQDVTQVITHPHTDAATQQHEGTITALNNGRRILLLIHPALLLLFHHHHLAMLTLNKLNHQWIGALLQAAGLVLQSVANILPINP